MTLSITRDIIFATRHFKLTNFNLILFFTENIEKKLKNISLLKSTVLTNNKLIIFYYLTSKYTLNCKPIKNVCRT